MAARHRSEDRLLRVTSLDLVAATVAKGTPRKILSEIRRTAFDRGEPATFSI
jgi:hypothetical protein